MELNTPVMTISGSRKRMICSRPGHRRATPVLTPILVLRESVKCHRTPSASRV